MRYLLPTASLLLVFAATPGLPWGVKGHTWVCENAIALLPPGELRDTLQPARNDIAANSLIPDFQWKDGSIARLEGPDHYIDLDAMAPQPRPEMLPSTRVDAARLYTRLGLSYRAGGFLPWRIEEGYWALANAFRTDPGAVPFYAGVLAHYAADATQPLHTTMHFDGRADRIEDGRKHLQGIHLDYEVIFLEDRNLEFRLSSLTLAQPPRQLPNVLQAAIEIVFDSFQQVESLYAAAERHAGEDRYVEWEREIGPLTRRQLAKAATFVASLWWSAWLEASQQP